MLINIFLDGIPMILLAMLCTGLLEVFVFVVHALVQDKD